MVSYIPVLTTLFSVFFLSRIVPHYLAKRSPYLLWWTLGRAHLRHGHAHRKHQCHFRLERVEHQGLVHRRRPAGRISAGPGDHLPADEQTLRRYLGHRVLGGHRRCRCLCPGLADRNSGRLRSPPHRKSVCVAMGQWHFSSLAQHSMPSFFFLAVLFIRPSSISQRTREETVSSAISSSPLGRCFPASAEASPAFGYVEVLYITEFIGLVFIYFGYHMMRKDHSASLHANQQTLEGLASPVDSASRDSLENDVRAGERFSTALCLCARWRGTHGQITIHPDILRRCSRASFMRSLCAVATWALAQTGRASRPADATG